MKLTVQQLRYLIKIAELGSITRAAKYFGVSQSAVSLVVAQVEKELGFSLFTRSKKGASPTNDALDFLTRSRRIVREMDELEQIYSSAEPRKIRFAITAMPLVFAENAFEDIAQSEIGQLYRFSLREADMDRVVEDVHTGVSDMGILLLSEQERRRLYSYIDQKALEYGEIFSTQPYAFVSTSHPLAGKETVTYDDLEQYPRVSMVQTMYTERVVRAGTAEDSEDGEGTGADADATAQEFRGLGAAHRLVGAEISLKSESYSVWCLKTPEVVLNGVAAIPIKTTHPLHVGCVVPKGAPLSDIENQYIEAIRQFAE